MKQLMWLVHKYVDWLYDEQDIHPVNKPVTRVIVNDVINGAPVAWTTYVILLLQNWTTVPEALPNLLSHLSHMVLTDTNNI